MNVLETLMNANYVSYLPKPVSRRRNVTVTYTACRRSSCLCIDSLVLLPFNYKYTFWLTFFHDTIPRIGFGGPGVKLMRVLNLLASIQFWKTYISNVSISKY